LFEQHRLEDNLSFEDLVRALKFTSRSLREDNLIENLERQKKVCEYINNLSLRGSEDPNTEIKEIEGRLNMIRNRAG